jgi:carboxyl-terminal processing protease
MRGRELDLNLLVNPQPNPYLGKVMILMDYGTASTSEIFAIGLQENGRAVLIGETTAGMALPSIFETLPTGALFQYAIMDYTSPKGTLVEGRGVKPDLEVSQIRQDLLDGRDLPLEIAIQNIIRDEK